MAKAPASTSKQYQAQACSIPHLQFLFSSEATFATCSYPLFFSFIVSSLPPSSSTLRCQLVSSLKSQAQKLYHAPLHPHPVTWRTTTPVVTRLRLFQHTSFLRNNPATISGSTHLSIVKASGRDGRCNGRDGWVMRS